MLNTGSVPSVIAWAPVGDDNYNPMLCRQYLAVGTSSIKHVFHTLQHSYSGPHMLQIWDVDHLTSDESGNLTGPSREPRLSMGILHSRGFVRDLQWFPSGSGGNPNVWQPVDEPISARVFVFPCCIIVDIFVPCFCCYTLCF